MVSEDPAEDECAINLCNRCWRLFLIQTRTTMIMSTKYAGFGIYTIVSCHINGVCQLCNNFVWNLSALLFLSRHSELQHLSRICYHVI